MSTILTVYCAGCDERGPDIRLASGGATLLPAGFTEPESFDEWIQRAHVEWWEFAARKHAGGVDAGHPLVLIYEDDHVGDTLAGVARGKAR